MEVHLLSYGRKITPESLPPPVTLVSSVKSDDDEEKLKEEKVAATTTIDDRRMESGENHHHPPTSTYFSKTEVQYSPLNEDGDIELDAFLRACRGIVEFVGFMGKAFSPVKDDINGNILKVDRVYQTDTQKYATVKKLLDAEIIDWPNRMGPATFALLWLKRALEFNCAFLDLLVLDHKSGKKSTTLASMGKEAYHRTLRKHHGTIERGLFKVIIHATPYRKDFLKRVAAGRTDLDDECVSNMAAYLDLMKVNVDRVVSWYEELGFEK